MARKKSFKPAYENFPVSKFKGISFGFEDDVYECAWLLLRLDDAKGRAPIRSTATPSMVWPVTSRLSRISQRPTSWRSLNAESCHCERPWNSMPRPCPQ